jgi:uncharacterized protein involved in exopolysaccharide biosynthesis
MPTPTGGETIAERLKRLNVELARVRATIGRAETNGQENSMGGTSVTEIAYERAEKREQKLVNDIAVLEGRLAGSTVQQGIAQLQTCME